MNGGLHEHDQRRISAVAEQTCFASAAVALRAGRVLLADLRNAVRFYLTDALRAAPD